MPVKRLERVDAEVDVVERCGAGDVGDARRVRAHASSHFGDRGVGDAEHGDVRLGDLVVATERAVDGES